MLQGISTREAVCEILVAIAREARRHPSLISKLRTSVSAALKRIEEHLKDGKRDIFVPLIPLLIESNSYCAGCSVLCSRAAVDRPLLCLSLRYRHCKPFLSQRRNGCAVSHSSCIQGRSGAQSGGRCTRMLCPHHADRPAQVCFVLCAPGSRTTDVLLLCPFLVLSAVRIPVLYWAC